jgi:hypothetical protein
MPVNFFITIFNIFLFIIFLNCASSESLKNISTNSISGDYINFIETKQENPSENIKLDFFEKGSSSFRFLIISPLNENRIDVIEKEFYFYSYKESFLKKTSEQFQGRKPKRFYIKEIIKKGTGKKIKEELLIVDFKSRISKFSESDSILQAIEDFKSSNQEYTNYFKITKKFSKLDDSNLWTDEELFFIDNVEFIQWRNFPSSAISSIAISETKYKRNHEFRTSISDIEKYKYKKLDSKPILLFEDSNYYILLNTVANKKYDTEISSEATNKKYSLLKNENPFLIYKSRD